MRVTFPRMGTVHLAADAILRELGAEVVVPPEPTSRTLELGVRLAPESACLPLKINLGNLMEAIERGADTVVMVGGIGPCRLGLYAAVQGEVLRQAGVDVRFVVLEPPRGDWRPVLEQVKSLGRRASTLAALRAAWLGWQKLVGCDAVHRALPRARCREALEAASSGKASTRRAERVYARYVAKIAAADRAGAVREAVGAGIRELGAAGGGEPEGGFLRVAVFGEIYMVHEPFASQRAEEELGYLGVLTERVLYTSDWVRRHLLPAPCRALHERRVDRDSRGHLESFVGGEGQESVAAARSRGRSGFDGAVHLAPLTCMPEIVAQAVMPGVVRETGMPVLTLYFDEHSSAAGVRTRLEAFVDLLERKRERDGRCS